MAVNWLRLGLRRGSGRCGTVVVVDEVEERKWVDRRVVVVFVEVVLVWSNSLDQAGDESRYVVSGFVREVWVQEVVLSQCVVLVYAVEG